VFWHGGNGAVVFLAEKGERVGVGIGVLYQIAALAWDCT
jgi:hypothetical protein